MEIKIHADYCEVREALELLWLAVNTTKAERREAASKVRGWQGTSAQAVDQAEKIMGLADQISVTERLRYYFEELQNDYLCCLASALLLTFDHQLAGDASAVRSRVQEAYASYEPERFPTFEEFGTGLLLQQETRPVWKSVQSMSIEEKYKARMVFAFADFENSLDEVFALLQEPLALLAPFRAWGEAQAQSFAESWRVYFRTHTGAEFLEKLNMKTEADSLRTLHLYLCAANGLTLRFALDGREAPELSFYAGFAADEAYLDAWERQGKRGVQETLRLLADPSKLEILLYIRDTPHYGKEIADHFGLSTPTVSYHMNELLQQSLIRIDQQGKRMYYEMNRKKIADFLEGLRGLLAAEDGFCG